MNSYLEYLFAKKLLDINTKNLTESNKLKLADRVNKFLFEAEQDWVTITIPSIGIAYAAGATDSKPFINDIWTKVNAAIEANTTTKELKTANNLAVQKLQIYAGSSNNYNGTPTQYDTNNDSLTAETSELSKQFGAYAGWTTPGQGYGDISDYDVADLKTKGVTKTFTNQTMISGYKSNLELAKKRVADLATNLKSLMATNGITIPDPTKGQGYEEIFVTGVVNTGGVLDDKRDTNIYKNPGQSAIIIITLSGKEDIIKFPVTTEELKAGLANKTILWGSIGGNSQDGVIDPLQEWELKYLPGEGQGKNTYVKPIVRWSFEYNAKNQLIKVKQIPDPGNLGIPTAVKLAFPAKEYIISPAGKAQLQTKVPLVYELLVAAGVYNRFFDAVP